MPQDQSDIFARFMTGGKLDLDQLRRAASQSNANDKVNLSNWRVQYPPDWQALEALCTVAPKSNKDAISAVYIAALSSDGSVVYAHGGVNVNSSAPGVEFGVASSTALWNSEDRGAKVTCIVSGTIGKESFFFEQNFTVNT